MHLMYVIRVTREDIMIENIAMKRISLLNKKQKEYKEQQLIEQVKMDAMSLLRSL